MIRRLLQRLDEILSVFWVYAPQGALPDTLWRRKRNISGQKIEKAAKRVRAASRTGQRFSAAAKTGVCVFLLLLPLAQMNQLLFWYVDFNVWIASTDTNYWAVLPFVILIYFILKQQII